MITVSNDIISVELSESAFKKQGSLDAYRRSNVLSKAMQILQIRQETAALNLTGILVSNEALIDALVIAHVIISDQHVESYLNEHSKFTTGETFEYYKQGKVLSGQMICELELALDHVYSILGGGTGYDIFNKIADKFTEYQQQGIFSAYRDGKQVLDEEDKVQKLAKYIIYSNLTEEALSLKFKLMIENFSMDITILKPNLIPDEGRKTLAA